jgi:hypothetical protein
MPSTNAATAIANKNAADQPQPLLLARQEIGNERCHSVGIFFISNNFLEF